MSHQSPPPTSPRPARLTRRKTIAFAAAAMLLGMVATLAALLLADLYLHRRAERSAGLNRWGYRGPVVGRKQPGETRVAMLGGSTMFGYGVPWHESIPALLETELAKQGSFSTINLAFNAEGAFAALPVLQDYAWLDYDIVVMYHGYNDLHGDSVPNRFVARDESAVFRLTGYFPILPLMLREKALAIRSGGNLEAAYRDNPAARPVFRPSVAQRTSATALEAMSSATAALGDQLARVTSERQLSPTSGVAGCEAPWVHFCDSLYRAVKYARGRGAGVVVVSQPSSLGEIRPFHDEQRQRSAAMLTANFGHDKAVLFVDLSEALNLADTGVSFDGMHLSVEGNREIAARLAEPVRTVARNLGR